MDSCGCMMCWASQMRLSATTTPKWIRFTLCFRLCAHSGITYEFMCTYEAYTHIQLYHDAFLLAELRLLKQLNQLPRSSNGHTYVLYRDLAYPMREKIIKPFPETCEGPDVMKSFRKCRTRFQQASSKLRVCGLSQKSHVILTTGCIVLPRGHPAEQLPH